MARLPKYLAVGSVMILAAVAASGQKGESAADKSKREQAEKAAIAQNERITRSNETIAKAFAAGNVALAAKDFDAAIAEYNKGIAADPTHPGTASLHTNKSVALRSRGVQEFNSALQLTDPGVKAARQGSARKDFREAVNSANEALRVFNTQSQPASPVEATSYKLTKYAVLFNRAESYKLFVVKVDKSQADSAMNAYRELFLVEESDAKRFKSRVEAGMMLIEAGLYERAALEFRGVLSSDPKNFDAHFGLGYALFATGIKNNYREALTSIQKFEELAPATHPRSGDANLMLEFLKAELGS